MVNNITLFGKIANRNKLKTNDEFISYIRTNLGKLYGADGAESKDDGADVAPRGTEHGFFCGAAESL